MRRALQLPASLAGTALVCGVRVAALFIAAVIETNR
jgi:hypothetical protein